MDAGACDPEDASHFKHNLSKGNYRDLDSYFRQKNWKTQSFGQKVYNLFNKKRKK